MTKFSANLGFLWADLELPDAIRSAKRAGFDAVECHWPYDTPTADVAKALEDTGLEMLGINTSRGNVASGEMGLSALSDRTVEARDAIDQAIAYAEKIGTKNIHVMAGYSSGELAHQTFVENLKYACAEADQVGINILIEPINPYDAPGYFLNNLCQAEAIIDEVDVPNLKLMFDCYHIQLIHGDISNNLKRVMSKIGHIQFASVPDRSEPDQGELSYSYVFSLISSLGYQAPLGAEYKPSKPTAETLSWMTRLR